MMTNQDQDSAEVTKINENLDQIQELHKLLQLDQKIANYLKEADQ